MYNICSNSNKKLRGGILLNFCCTELCLLLSLRCVEPLERDKKFEQYAAQEVAKTRTKNQCCQQGVLLEGHESLKTD